jgi:hypothetical protein
MHLTVHDVNAAVVKHAIASYSHSNVAAPPAWLHAAQTFITAMHGINLNILCGLHASEPLSPVRSWSLIPATTAA